MRSIKYICLIVTFSLLFCGCSVDVPKGHSAVELYFVNPSRDTFVTETVYIPESDFSTTKTLVYAVMEKLLDGPSSAEHARVIPENVTLKGFSQSKTDYGTINIDLSGEFYQIKSGDVLPSDEILARYSIICTLCQFENIRKVKFYVDGEELKSLSGKGDVIQPMGSDSILTNSPSSVENQTEKFITLYFTDKTGKKLLPETRKATMTDNSLEKTIINELIKGPFSEDLEPTLPESTKLVSVETTEEICFVNLLSSSLEKIEKGSQKERIAVYSIVNSITRIAGIEKVQILIDGKKAETDISHLFSSPLEHNKSIIKEAEASSDNLL